MKKDKLIESVKELPQEFDLEQFIEKLIFTEKVEKGLNQLDESKVMPHEKVKDLARKW